MLITKLLEHGTKVDRLGDISLLDDGLYFIEYNNIDRFNEDRRNIKEYALYEISHKLGIVNGRFHFDVADSYANITYIKLER